MVGEYLLARLNVKGIEKSKDLSVFFGFKCAGSVIGKYIGGLALTYIDIKIPFLFASLGSISLLFAGFIFKEEHVYTTSDHISLTNMCQIFF